MANVRMAESGVVLFPLVRGAAEENVDASMFPTYAHLICTAAALALRDGEIDEEPAFRDKAPLPIQVEIFRNQKLYDFMLLMAISWTDDAAIAANPEEVCSVVEKLSSAGFRQMAALMEEGGSIYYWTDNWKSALGVDGMALEDPA